MFNECKNGLYINSGIKLKLKEFVVSMSYYNFKFKISTAFMSAEPHKTISFPGEPRFPRTPPPLVKLRNTLKRQSNARKPFASY